MPDKGLDNLTKAQIDSFPFGELYKQNYLGDGHWYSLTVCDYEHCKAHSTTSLPSLISEPDKHGMYKHGIIQPHLRADGKWCGGGVTFEGHAGTTWQLLSLEPLHIEPSLLCRASVYDVDENGLRVGEVHGECGDHGFIREGKWVQA